MLLRAVCTRLPSGVGHSRSFPMEKLQLAFLQRDRCFEATNLLPTILREAHSNYTSRELAILDISKAFDSALHQTILRVTVSLGMPQMLREYLTHKTSLILNYLCLHLHLYYLAFLPLM
uniref:Reverse transcriptase domain-containing protein n=1 Tax=Trichobilharzia regenti TaxID=157069 RepID=A0AA85J5J1_TRIRE|nr:unnamed protein product [Trichobilharzia regenti]